jgi:hypothetical protein
MNRTLLTFALLASASPALAQAQPDTIIPKGSTTPEAWQTVAIPVAVRDYRIHDPLEATRKAAMRWEMAFVGLTAIDLIQTVTWCAHHDPCEANPLVGKHPSATKLILVTGIGTAAHFEFVRRLSRDHPKAALRFAQVSVGIRGTVVGINFRTLLK